VPLDLLQTADDGARCVDSGETLTCFTDGFFLGRFLVERAGKNRKLALRGADDHLAVGNVFVSTIFSIATLPVVLMAINWFLA
jgi:hypothetical protein